MLKGARAAITLMGVAALGTAACGDRDDDASGEPLVSERDEVEALDPALASRLPAGASMSMAEEGRALYVVCAPCHGLDARGTPLGPSLRDSEWIGISGELEEIRAVIRDGVAEPQEFPIPMPVMGGGDFTAEQLQALATYVYVLSRETP